MNRKRLACLSLLTSLAAASLGQKSIAHAPVANVLPVSHAALALRLLTGRVPQDTSFSHLTRALLSSRVPGYSGATSVLFKQTKLAAGTGILNGIKSRINGAPYSSGSYYGTVYENFFASGGQSFAQIYVPLGSNNLSNTIMGSVSKIVSPSSVFTYSKGAGFASVALAKELQSIKNVAAINPAFAFQINSLKEGENIGTTGLTGGFLSGQIYQNVGSTYLSYSKDVFTFGSNPFNTGVNSSSSAFNLYNSPSYLTFLNKIKIQLSSGQFSGPVLEGVPQVPYTNIGTYLFAIGKNPYNNNISGYALSAALKYLSYLKY